MKTKNLTEQIWCYIGFLFTQLEVLSAHVQNVICVLAQYAFLRSKFPIACSEMRHQQKNLKCFFLDIRLPKSLLAKDLVGDHHWSKLSMI